jgi:hypothetical protein
MLPFGKQQDILNFNSIALLLAAPPRQLRERVRTKQTEKLRIRLPKWQTGWG